MNKQILSVLILVSLLALNVLAMDLNESIDIAIKKNPTIIAAQKKAAAAQARLNQAASTFFPTLDLNGNVNNAYTQPATVKVTMGGIPQTITIGSNDNATITGVQAELSQPLFVSALFPQYGIAKKSTDSANENYQQVIVDSTFNVTQTYFGVLKTIKMEKLMADSLELARSHREQVESKFKAGVVTKADLLKSKVREANATVALTKSKYNIDLAKDSFNNALGNNMKQPVDLKDQGFSGKITNLPTFDSLLETAFTNRPDWKIYLLSIGISEDQVKLSRSDYLPSFVLNANTGNQATRYPDYESNVNSWKIAGIGSWKLFDSFGRENRVQEAAENLSAQQANVEQIKNNIALEVHNAYLNLKSALDVVDSTQQAVESAQESYKVADSRYNTGLGTNIEVIDAQVDLTQAWTDHLNALFDVEISKAKINRAVGKTII